MSAGSGTGIDLVTGANGFVGRHLVRRLVSRGRRVRALDLSLDRLEAIDGVERIEGDVGHATSLRRAFTEPAPEVVYHLAAAHLAVSMPEREYRRVNVEAAAGLARAAATESGGSVRRFVHVSSVGVYGELASVPADEDTPCRPGNAYERTKLAGEEAVLAVHRRRGLPVVVLRPAWIYGPGCGRTEKLFRAIARRRFVQAGDGSKRRHGIFVDDFLDALEAAASPRARPALGQVVLVADDEPAPVARWLETIARLVGRQPPPRLPLPLFRATASVVEACFGLVGLEPPISRRTLLFFTANTAFDTARAKRLLGFAPRHGLESGLAETARRLADAADAQAGR